MFGKKEPAVVVINSILGPGACFEGSLTAEGSVRIDGRITGDVKVTGTLIVGSAGVVTGNIDAEAVVIGGEVCGNITAPLKAELIDRAKVKGDITTNEIEIDDTAEFLGTMYQHGEDSTVKAAIPRTAKPSDRPMQRTAIEALKQALKDTEENK